MATFDRVYFDTNTLITGQWPAADTPSALLRPILELARDVNVGLFVPEPARIETEMVWMRELYRMRKDEATQERATDVVARETFVTPWAAVLDAYRSRERRLMETWRINGDGTVAFPSQTIEAAFRDAVDVSPPYDGRGRHDFRDIIIYLSVVEHLQGDPGVGVLVTDDKFFARVGEEREAKWRTQRGVNLSVIRSPESKSLEALQADLQEMKDRAESPERKTWRQRDEEQAREAFLAKGLDELRVHIEKHLRYPPTFPYQSARFSVTSVNVGRVVTTANQGTADGSPVKLTARVTAEFRAVRTQWVFVPSIVGPDVSPTAGTTFVSSGVSPTLGTTFVYSGAPSASSTPISSTAWPANALSFYVPTIPDVLTGMVLVRANATFRGGRYEDLDFEVATLTSWEIPAEKKS